MQGHSKEKEELRASLKTAQQRLSTAEAQLQSLKASSSDSSDATAAQAAQAAAELAGMKQRLQEADTKLQTQQSECSSSEVGQLMLPTGGRGCMVHLQMSRPPASITVYTVQVIGRLEVGLNRWQGSACKPGCATARTGQLHGAPGLSWSILKTESPDVVLWRT